MQFMPMALAISTAVQGAIEFSGQRQLAKDQTAQNNELRQNALEARDNDLAAIAQRRKEEKDAASQKALQVQREATAERSSALAASSQAGQSGLSVQALLSDYLRKSLDNEQTIQANLTGINRQLDRERQASINTARSRVNAAPSVSNPSFLTAGLKIGSDSFLTYEAAKPPETPAPGSRPPIPKRKPIR